MRHWFIGDAAIVRYGDDGERVRVAVASALTRDLRKYRVSLVDGDGREQRFEEWTSLVSALSCGEEWLP